ncbi:MAG: GNAT family N-acetyltransferase [Jannaschia sp.]
MIRADASHRPALEAALGKRPELAMFPLANLGRYGLSGGHPRATTFWLDDADVPTAILGVTEEGMVLPLWSDGFDPARAVPLLRGRALMGLAGPAGPVRALMAVADLADAPCRLAEDEPQFLLDLAALSVPDGLGALAPITAHKDIAVALRRAYIEELHLPGEDDDQSVRDVESWIEADSHRFLMIDGAPAALTGFNATLPQIVQVGGVYTPPDTRGRGLARRAVALHLAKARQAEVARATLFAASEAAVACYRPLGFERIGEYALILFDGKVTP